MRRICLLLALSVVLGISGCAKGQAAKETEKETTAKEAEETVKRRFEIYSAEDSSTILVTIEDQEIVNKLMDDSGWTDVEKAPEGLEPEYGIVVWQEKKVNYKQPEGTEPEFEIIETITTFKDSDYIEKVYSQDAVKNAMLPVSAVGFYYTVPDEFFELLQDVLKQ